jgi:hypothetical protein
VLLPIKKSARSVVLLTTLLLPALPAVAAEGRSWVADEADGAVWIIYGTPESDDVLLSVACEKATKTVTVWFATEPVSAKNPETLPLVIASEGGTARLTGQGSRSEMDDSYSLEAKTPLTPALEKLLADARKIAIQAEGAGKAEMPLDDLALTGAQDVVKGCK